MPRLVHSKRTKLWYLVNDRTHSIRQFKTREAAETYAQSHNWARQDVHKKRPGKFSTK